MEKRRQETISKRSRVITLRWPLSLAVTVLVGLVLIASCSKACVVSECENGACEVFTNDLPHLLSSLHSTTLTLATTLRFINNPREKLPLRLCYQGGGGGGGVLCLICVCTLLTVAVHVYLYKLLLCAGDIEMNPGPVDNGNDNDMRNERDDRILSAIEDLRRSQQEAVVELRRSHEQLSAQLDKTIGAAVEDLRAGQASLQNDIDQLQEDNYSLRQKVESLETKLEHVESDRRRMQIWIHGIPKTRDGGTNCESVVKNFFKTKLKIDGDVYIERAQRVGNAIAVKFLSLRDRDFVMSLGRLLKGSSLSMRPDTSKTVRDKVRGLVALKQSYRKDNKKAFIRHDKLFTPDGIFTFNLDTQCVEKLNPEADTRERRSPPRHNNDVIMEHNGGGDDDDDVWAPRPRGDQQHNLQDTDSRTPLTAYAGRGSARAHSTQGQPSRPRGFGRGRPRSGEHVTPPHNNTATSSTASE